jgi:hypothetical protein
MESDGRAIAICASRRGVAIPGEAPVLHDRPRRSVLWSPMRRTQLDELRAPYGPRTAEDVKLRRLRSEPVALVFEVFVVGGVPNETYNPRETRRQKVAVGCGRVHEPERAICATSTTEQVAASARRRPQLLRPLESRRGRVGL